LQRSECILVSVGHVGDLELRKSIGHVVSVTNKLPSPESNELESLALVFHEIAYLFPVSTRRLPSVAFCSVRNNKCKGLRGRDWGCFKTGSTRMSQLHRTPTSSRLQTTATTVGIQKSRINRSDSISEHLHGRVNEVISRITRLLRTNRPILYLAVDFRPGQSCVPGPHCITFTCGCLLL
jgi:hypothetical protein